MAFLNFKNMDKYIYSFIVEYMFFFVYLFKYIERILANNC